MEQYHSKANKASRIDRDRLLFKYTKPNKIKMSMKVLNLMLLKFIQILDFVGYKRFKLSYRGKMTKTILLVNDLAMIRKWDELKGSGRIMIIFWFKLWINQSKYKKNIPTSRGKLKEGSRNFSPNSFHTLLPNIIAPLSSNSHTPIINAIVRITAILIAALPK